MQVRFTHEYQTTVLLTIIYSHKVMYKSSSIYCVDLHPRLLLTPLASVYQRVLQMLRTRRLVSLVTSIVKFTLKMEFQKKQWKHSKVRLRFVNVTNAYQLHTKLWDTMHDHLTASTEE